MLKVKLFNEGAKAPVCSRPGEDLGFDIFALEDTTILPYSVTKVRTGIGLEWRGDPTGFIVKDRSSMASYGVVTHGGVIDAGYRGEIIVLMSVIDMQDEGYFIKAGDKIAQLIPVVPLTEVQVQIVDELKEANRGEKGFGSSGR